MSFEKSIDIYLELQWVQLDILCSYMFTFHFVRQIGASGLGEPCPTPISECYRKDLMQKIVPDNKHKKQKL